MADTTEMQYIRTFLEAVHKGTLAFSDVVASVTTATKKVTLTTNGATLNQYAGYCLFVVSGDNAGDEYTVVSCTAATPTVLTVAETITADLATDVVKLYSGATAKNFSEYKNIDSIPDTERMLVYLPEMMGTYANTKLLKFMVKLSVTSEAHLTVALNNIINGIIKLENQETIDAYTKPATLAWIEFAGSRIAYEQKLSKRWYMDIWLNVCFTTS